MPRSFTVVEENAGTAAGWEKLADF